MATKLKTSTKTIKPKKLKKWFFGEFTENGEIDYVNETLLTEEEFINQDYDANCQYFKIDPIHIEKIKVEIKVEIKIVKA